jgi:hypothetical protein
MVYKKRITDKMLTDKLEAGLQFRLIVVKSTIQGQPDTDG